MCLDEWKSGSYKPLMFSSDVYEPVFKDHLANLKTMEKEDPLFVKGIGEELWEDCRYADEDFGTSHGLTLADPVSHLTWRRHASQPHQLRTRIRPRELLMAKNVGMRVPLGRWQRLQHLLPQVTVTYRLSPSLSLSLEFPIYRS